MSDPLGRLLSPYRSAIAGTPTTEASISQDPLLKLLMPQLLGGSGGGRRTPTELKALAKRLERMGFDVGELEGFQGEGQITSGHAPNSLHYSGDAFDVNYRGGGKWGNETDALNFLYKWLNKRYDPQELLWQTDDHYDHLHLGGI